MLPYIAYNICCLTIYLKPIPLNREVKGRKKVGAFKATVIAEETIGEEESLVEELKALVSTVSKRLNRGQNPAEIKGTKKVYEKHECIAKGCAEETTFPLCKLHYHSLVSGKSASIDLIKDWGNATYDESSKQIVYPVKVPEGIRPKGKPKAQ